MVTTFTAIFLPVFFGLFVIIFFWLVIVPQIRRCIVKRARNRNWSNDTELTAVAGSADINRISAADFPPRQITLRDCHRRPSAARLARRSERLSRDYQNPFADPPRHYPSVETLIRTPHNRTTPNFSTPTRRGRHRSPTQDATSTLRPAPTVIFTEYNDPFNPPEHDVRPSQSLTSSERSGRHISIVSFPEPSYQPAILSVADLAKCEPRSAGQAPPLGKKLEKFPLPKLGTAHLHPVSAFTRTADELPPTPPATVTRIRFPSTGAKTPVSQIRRLFNHETADPMPSLHVPKPSIAASSFYSCDEQGNHQEEEEENEVAITSPPHFSRPFPQGKAPGGAEWV